MPEKAFLSINDVLESTLELCSYKLHVDNIRVQREMQPDLPRTMADFHQMQQVFMNVIMNAHQAILESNRKGVIKVRSAPTGGMLRVEIADNGCGIESGNLQKIFDPFFSTRPAGQGAGLGLSICHDIVKEHAGRIWAAGGGRQETRILVELPILAPPETQTPGAAQQAMA
jgi:two-component system NtrC family sensor kinase